MSASALRVLLSPAAPMLFGQYPDRPAPAHVLNGFVAASLGVSSIERDLRALLVPDAEMPESFSFLRVAGWATDDSSFSRFRDDLSTVFNPDRRLWEKFGSPVPVHALLASADASDDGYGAGIWDLVRRHVSEPAFIDELNSLLSPLQASDPVTAVAQVLVADANVARKREVQVHDSVWYGPYGPDAGKFLATQIAELIHSLVALGQDQQRLMRIQHLARGLYLSAFLCLILGPIAAASDASAESSADLASLVIWGGTPPGPPADPMVAASARSFQTVVEQNRRALLALLHERISNVQIASTTPASLRRRSALRQVMIDAGSTEGQADKAIEQFETQGLPVGQGEFNDASWLEQLLDLGYSTNELAKAFRTTGRKVGIVAPDRGAGAPRFVLETPLLGTLVAAVCQETSLPFEQFVDAIRDRFGIVVGPGTLDELPSLELWESAGIAGQQLRDNQEMLRVRLVRAGLATEYSDGHTEVGIA